MHIVSYLLGPGRRWAIEASSSQTVSHIIKEVIKITKEYHNFNCESRYILSTVHLHFFSSKSINESPSFSNH
jgi:hypothetical protein